MQKGQIYKKGRLWMLKYREKRIVDGQQVWHRIARKLAPYNDEFRSAASVRHLAEEILAPLNTRQARPESTQTIVGFIENVFLPYIRQHLRPSTQKIYEHYFRTVKPHLGDKRLREFRISDAEQLLATLATENYAHTTYRNIRNFMSAVFRHARREEVFHHENPMRDARIPKGRKSQTQVYSLEEIEAILKILPEPARTAVLVAALTGLRHSEIRGLKWEDFGGEQLCVRRSVWGTHIGDTKTEDSSAPVPVIPVLRKALEAHRKSSVGEYIFCGSTGKPLVLANLVRRDIIPALEGSAVSWKGWHAFRRGLASNLYRLGVSDKVVQAILRHADVTTTMAYYVKTNEADAHAAMRKLSRVLGTSWGPSKNSKRKYQHKH